MRGSASEGDHGLALWYIKEPGHLGNVFGHADRFESLGVIFDSKDDDEARNNPSVSAHLYDGSVDFNHADDGVHLQLSGCVADYRNRPEPIAARVTYMRLEQKLSVYLDMTHRGRYQRCLIAENVDLPRSYFVGLSASTDSSDDQHTVESFWIRDLTSGAEGDMLSPELPPRPIPDSRGHIVATELREEEEPEAKKAPAQRLQQDIAQQREEVQKQKAPPSASHVAPPPPVSGDVHASVVQHTKHIANTVDNAVFQSHTDTRDHISSSLQGVKSHVESTLQEQMRAAVAEVRSLTERLAHGSASHLEKKIDELLLAVNQNSDTSLGAYAEHTNTALAELRGAVSEHSEAIAQSRNAHMSKLRTIENANTGIGAAVEEIKRDMLTQKKLGHINSQLGEIAHTLQAIDRRVRALEGDDGVKRVDDGEGWLNTILLLLVLGGVVFVGYQSHAEANRYKLP